MTDGPPFDVLSHHTCEALTHCLEEIRERRSVRDLPGDYLEFGVYQGHSLHHACREAERLGLDDMRFFGFDSFEGLPEPTGVDTVSMEAPAGLGPLEEGMFACTREQVLENLDRAGTDLSRVRLVEGFYDDTLVDETKEECGLTAAALVLVDCDLYGSSARVLRFVEDLVRDGSIIVLDDWHIFGGGPETGEHRAFREFLARNPRWRPVPFRSVGWHGESFVLRREEPVGS